ncbi:hypothetical protein [Aquimarina muelleri]|uniref:Uncharacterized protein n=1 Tax=Aquimarina muelleri TaxID=279356 RepID=A0A918JXY1_9FLAO|nr:hypothetical protein [Aquimarina muelleri]MCX2763718.1 hypothetical protein [Aquimarina muelleri]GGX30004.1 hypothetical protein GCM10007384_33970 [Aquimarina muelleri]
MKRDLLAEIIDLKKKLLKNDISIDKAIDQFFLLASHYQNESISDQEIILFEKPLPKIEKYFLEKNIKIKNKINKLNKILILQELGIQFSEKELNKLLYDN